jgi:choline dehydrogenase
MKTGGGSRRYDVVVVGGGAAGCALAARAAEAAPDAQILVLEAGPDLRADRPEGIRDGWGMLPRDQLDWGYVSEPGWFGDGRKARRVKALGGTSSITRFAVRGAPADFDEWVALGNPGWGWDDVLPWFRRLERDREFGDRPWHGSDGPMPVTRYLDIAETDIHAAAIEAAVATGFERIADHNRPGAVGIGRMPMHTVDGVRVTAADAYLPVDGTPPNVEIRTDTEVDRVTFDGDRASGVRLVDRSEIEAGVVVLCAGTYGSPAVLLRSGIGPAADLAALAIESRVDLPGVGRNLSDHPTTGIETSYVGPYRESPLVHTIATFHSSAAASDGPPDLMFWLTDPDTPENPPQWAVEVVLLKPRCRGQVALRSADPSEAPRIELPDPHDPADLDRLIEGVRRADDLLAELARRGHLGEPPPTRSREQAIAAIEAGWYSIPHVVGTCAMGPSPADGAVVDRQGHVHGTHALYVVDASIIPTEPSGFTLLPTIMLAERLASAIAADAAAGT